MFARVVGAKAKNGRGVFIMSSYKDLQAKIFERDNYTCQCCGKSSREYRALVMAHIRTASLCGDDRESNLIT